MYVLCKHIPKYFGCYLFPDFISETEALLNSVVSLLPYVPIEKKEEIIISLCEKLAKAHEGEKQKNVVKIKMYALHIDNHYLILEYKILLGKVVFLQ